MTFLPRARIKYQSAGFGVIFQVMNDLNSILLFYVNMFLRNFYLAYGSINPIGPQQHFVHRIVSQALDSFIVVFIVAFVGVFLLVVLKQTVIFNYRFQNRNLERDKELN